MLGTSPSYLKDVIKAEFQTRTDGLYSKNDERNTLMDKGMSNTSTGNRSNFRTYSRNRTVTWDPNNKNSSTRNASSRNSTREN